jgi:energy-converting hydrogenase Eha subunit C
MPMVMVNQLDWLLRTGAAAAGSIVVILRHEPLKVLLVLHPVQSQMQVETDAQITYAVQVVF